MLQICNKCSVEHDARDINKDGICIWCEKLSENDNFFIPSSESFAKKPNSKKASSRKQKHL